jgi:uncharacterized protein (TIGR03437 family)
VSIFGSNLATTTMQAQGTPLPTELAGTSVTFNGTRAPLLFASPNQINLQVPSSLPTSPIAYTQTTVVVTTASGSSSPVQVPVYASSPALFTVGGTGCGQAAASNIAPDGSVSVNSPTNSAAPGDYVSLFGTGLPTNPLPDGTYSTGPWTTSSQPGLSLDGNPVSVAYAGLAPFFVGVNQINFQIPQGAREGCAIPVSINSLGLVGPTLTISINSARGNCLSTKAISYGQATLTKTASSGTKSDGSTETFTAFPWGVGLMAPQPPSIAPSGSYLTAPVFTPVSQTCALFPQLSAGPIQAASLFDHALPGVEAQPISGADGVDYRLTLPDGFIEPGQYRIGAQNDHFPVSFLGDFFVGSPIQVQTPLVPGTQILSSQPLVIKWTDGDPGTLVKVSLVSVQGVYSQKDYGYADATSGSFTFSPVCIGIPVQAGGNGTSCSFGIPSSPTAEVIVEVYNPPTYAFIAAGLVESVQLSWVYRYVFGGLVLQ